MANTYSVFRKAWLLAALGATLPYQLPAQVQAVSGPQATYIFDATSGSIRRLIGRTGSAFLGDPVLTGLRTASIAPNGVSAIAVWENKVEWIADLGDSAGTPLLLDASLSNADQFFWGKSSSSVALFSSQGPSLQFIQWTPGTQATTRTVDLTALPRQPNVLAVDVDRTLAAVISTVPRGNPGAEALFLLQPGLSPIRVQTADSPVAASFAENGALYLAGKHSTVSVLQNPPTQTAADLLFQEADATTPPTAILARSGAGLIYLAEASLQRVRVYDAQSLSQIDELHLDWRPSRFAPFQADLFLLNNRTLSSEPILLLQTGHKSSVLFIPAGE